MTIKIDADTTSGLQLESDTSGIIDIQSAGVTKMTVGTTIDIQGNELVLDADADTSIHADTDDQIDFKTGGTDRMSIDSSGEVSIDSGYVTLNGNEIGGAQITIADDAVGTVVPPRNGGFLMMTTAGDTAFPNEPASAFLAYDVGSSLRTNIARSMDGVFDTAVEKATGALTGTSATNGNIKVSSNTGQIEINNRLGASVVIQLTFL